MLKPSEEARMSEVRRIGSDRAKDAAETLAAAFTNDPFHLWLLGGMKSIDSGSPEIAGPQNSEPESLGIQPNPKLEIFGEWVLRNAPAFSEIHAIGDISGVSLWVPSRELAEELKSKMPPKPSNPDLQATETSDVAHTAVKRAKEFLEMSQEIFGDRTEILPFLEGLHPDGKWWYLSAVGVHPKYFGQGRGTRLLQTKLAQIDELRLPAYLEATNSRNASLYARHGFEIVEKVDFKDCPTLYLMWRDAK